MRQQALFGGWKQVQTAYEDRGEARNLKNCEGFYSEIKSNRSTAIRLADNFRCLQAERRDTNRRLYYTIGSDNA